MIYSQDKKRFLFGSRSTSLEIKNTFISKLYCAVIMVCGRCLRYKTNVLNKLLHGFEICNVMLFSVSNK